MNRLVITILLTLISVAVFANNAVIKTALQEAVAENAVYKQITSEEHCPEFIMFESYPDEDTRNHRFHKAGDLHIILGGYSYRDSGKIGHDHFTHEGGNFHYRPKQRNGRKVTIGSDPSLSWGGYMSGKATQVVNGSKVQTVYTGRVYSVAMWGTTKYIKTFDAKNKTFVYYFEGTGVDDIRCVYKESPTSAEAVHEYEDWFDKNYRQK